MKHTQEEGPDFPQKLPWGGTEGGTEAFGCFKWTVWRQGLTPRGGLSKSQ